VLSNVFLHLHPAKIKSRCGALQLPPGAWAGLRFFCSSHSHLHRRAADVLLPSEPRCRRFAMCFISKHDVPFGKILPQHAPLGGPLDGDWCVAAHVPRIPDWIVQESPANLIGISGCSYLVFTLFALVHRYLCPTISLDSGGNCRHEHGAATPLLGHEGPFGSMLGMTPYNDVRFGLLGGSIVDANALLRSYIWHCIGIPIVASILMMSISGGCGRTVEFRGPARPVIAGSRGRQSRAEGRSAGE